MPDTVVDLFKFVTVRATQTPAATDLRVVRDARLGTPAREGERPDVAVDGANYASSVAATAIHTAVKELGGNATTPQAVMDANRAVTRRVLTGQTIDVTTGLVHVDAVVAVLDDLAAGSGDPAAAVVARWPFEGAGDTSWTAYAARKASDVGPDTPSLEADLGTLFDRLYLALVAKRELPINLERLIRGLRVLNLLRHLAADPPPGADDVTALCAANPAVHRLITSLVAYYHPFNPIRPVGIGDLLVVKQFLRRYEPGEVAHIENVLPDESKERKVRTLDRVDDLVSLVEEKSTTTEQELATSERFELKSETESTIRNDLTAEISGQVSGRYGVVEYSANAGVTYSTSSTDSRRGANNFAKDVVDRSLSRIQRNVRDERTTRRLTETEQTDTHQLGNTTGQPLAGVYRWVDKVYRAQVYNYGKRLMFEFVVPEPAAFVLSVFDHGRQQEERPKIPQEPVRPELDIATISAQTVAAYTKIFTVSGIEPEPPPAEVILTDVIEQPNLDTQSTVTKEKTFDVPDGYRVTKADVVGHWTAQHDFVTTKDAGGTVAVGGKSEIKPGTRVYEDYQANYTFTPPLDGKVKAVAYVYNSKAFAFAVALTLERTEAHLRRWQREVYEAIMDAYEQARREYLGQLSEYEAKLAGYKVAQGVVIQGRNPRTNLDVVRTELRKSCLSMIALQFDTEKSDDLTFEAMGTRDEKLPVEAVQTVEESTTAVSKPKPDTTVTVTTKTTTQKVTTADADIKVAAVNVQKAVDEGQVIQFLEQAFEWQQLNYVLYPYFWGRMPGKWYDAQNYYDEPDPLYAKFLQAGAARVLVSVRPGFEGAVQHYLQTREPWNGGPVPDIDDPLYLAVHAELRDQQDDLNNADPYGDAWTVVVPTPLVWLQPDGTLPTFDDDPASADAAAALWTGAAHQVEASVLATGQTAWASWPAAATWQVPVPEWATAVDVNFLLNPQIIGGDVWGELRLDIGGIATDASMFDVNYEADYAGFPEQTVMIVGDSVPIPPEMRGTTVPVRMQGRMLDPAHCPGHLQAARGCHVTGQLAFKRST